MTRRARNRAWWLKPGYQLLLLFAAVIVIAVAVAVIATQGEPQENALEYDARTYAIQFLLLTGLGAILAFLVDLERRTREAREQRRAFETETASSMLDQLDEIYANVKDTRRMLRVDRAIGELDAARLRERMLCVNQEQTRAEQLRKRMSALDPQMDGLEAVAAHLEEFDDYLSRCWGQYEKSPAPGPWLDPFLASAHDVKSDFKENLQRHYDEARKRLVRLLGELSTKAD